MENEKPVVLIILDGFGIGPENDSNAVYTANTPHLDDYKTRYPTAKNNGEIWDTPYQIGEFSDHYPLVDINVNYQTSSQTNSEENVFQNPFISIAGFDPNLFCVISGIFCLFLSFRIKKGKVK